MAEMVAIPKDLFEWMVEAVNELQVAFGDQEEEKEMRSAKPDYERIPKIVEDIEDNWHEDRRGTPGADSGASTAGATYIQCGDRKPSVRSPAEPRAAFAGGLPANC